MSCQDVLWQMEVGKVGREYTDTISKGLPKNKKEARALRQRKKLSAVTKANQVIV